MWAKIDDSSEDALVSQLIVAARMAAEEYLRRSLITQSWKLSLDLAASSIYGCLEDGVYDLPVTAMYGGLPSTIALPRAPIQSITSIITYDLNNTPSTFDPANYHLDTAGERLNLSYGAMWPTNLRQLAACEITYVAGYGSTPASVPQPIKSAMLIHIASLYEQRGQCEDEMALPPGAMHLLNRYRILGERRG
ncbi:hypothetical protein BH10PLA2_BH10PLA2_00570 [soil metagenome]